jgi:SPP1 gp7 family putative phage head morphogenesis protein
MVTRTKLLRPVHPNLGLEAEYRRRLEAMVDAMHRSLMWWLVAGYRQNEPATQLAMDASSAVELGKIMSKLRRYWMRKFNEGSLDLAKYFVDKNKTNTDDALQRILKESGLAIKFKTTAAVNDVLQASVNENVSLIKSIAQQHLTEVEGLVMRSVQAGRDVGGLAKELEKRYEITKKRAKFIARDQNSKATATITRVRQHEAGITEAKWLHSHGGKEPRPNHVAMSGHIYKIAEGMWDPDADGKGKGRYIFPGELINCRCVSRAIIPALT